MPETAPPPEPPLRTCPSCGREGRTRYERCPHCQTSYYARSRTQRTRRLLGAGAALVVLAVLVVVGSVVAFHDKDHREAREKVTDARVVAQLRAKLTRIQAPHHGADRALKPPRHATRRQLLAARAALVVAVERRITRDAQARVKTGELQGPIGSTSCGPILKSQKAIPDDEVLSKHIGRYDCIAIKRDVISDTGAKVAELGDPFVAALDFDTYTYTWCRNTPAQGERGVALVFVRLDRSCLAATGKALGTGYAATPDELGATR